MGGSKMEAGMKKEGKASKNDGKKKDEEGKPSDAFQQRLYPENLGFYPTPPRELLPIEEAALDAYMCTGNLIARQSALERLEDTARASKGKLESTNVMFMGKIIDALLQRHKVPMLQTIIFNAVRVYADNHGLDAACGYFATTPTTVWPLRLARKVTWMHVAHARLFDIFFTKGAVSGDEGFWERYAFDFVVCVVAHQGLLFEGEKTTRARRVLRILRNVLDRHGRLCKLVVERALASPELVLGALSVAYAAAPENDALLDDMESREHDIVAHIEEKLLLGKSLLGPAMWPLYAPLLRFLGADPLCESMARAVKRDPGRALPSVTFILKSVTYGLDKRVHQLTMAMTPCLISADEHIRTHAINGFKLQMIAVEKPHTVIYVEEHLIDVLEGRHGKVSQWEQRHAPVTALLGLKQVDIAPGFHSEIRSTALSGLLRFFDKESHEPMKQTLLDVICELIPLSEEYMPEVTAFVKKQLAAKKTTPDLRLCLMRVAAANFKHHADKVEEFLPELEASLTAAPKQELSWQGQAEAIHAALIYFSFAVTQPANEEEVLQNTGVWAKLNAGHVFNERLVANCTKQDAMAAAHLCCELLRVTCEDEARDDLLWPWLLISTLCDHPCSRTRHAVSTVVAPAMPTLPPGAALSLAHAHHTCLRAAYRRQAGLDREAKVPFLCSATTSYISALMAIANRGELATEEERSALLLELLPNINHPHITAFKPNLLLTVGRNLYDVTQLIEKHGAAVLGLLKDVLRGCYAREEDEDRVAAMRHMVCTMTRVRGFDAIREQLVRRILSVLGQPQLLSTTMKDVNIFNTPEGELYDTSFLPKAKHEPAKNQKGYEDLKWEMEVRKELAKKKGKKLDAGPKLTKHHLELKEKTLKTEADVRQRMRDLDQQVFVAFVPLEGLLRGNVRALSPSVPVLTSSLLRVVRMSALAGPRAAVAFVHLSAVLNAYVREDKARELGVATVGLAGSKAPLPELWQHEDPVALTVRLMRELLHTAHDEHRRVDDVGMSYLLPLMLQLMKTEAIKDSTREDAMFFLVEHPHLGASGLLPRSKMLTLLVDVMRSHPRIAHQAAIMLIEFVKHMRDAAASVEVKASETDILFEGYDSDSVMLRSSVMQSLLMLPFELTERNATVIWVAYHDEEEDVSQYAQELWKSRSFKLPADACSLLEQPLSSPHESVRAAAAKALGQAVEQHRDQVDAVLNRLMQSYVDLLVIPEPERDHVGNIISEPFVDPWPSRAGIALGFGALAPHLDEQQTLRILQFMLQTALGDRSDQAREAVVAAGQQIMMEQGRHHVSTLLPVFDKFLSKPSKTTHQDTVRRGAIVLLGSVATHLDPNDPRIPAITDSLIATLSTPSQKVQEAVAKCLQPLIAATKERGPELLDMLMKQALSPGAYGERRGAAYGVAAVVKACGLKVFKAYNGTAKLIEAVNSKGKQEKREGALMVIELLSLNVGRMFEPIIVELSPHLLLSFGDPKRDVRAAAKDTARAVMGKLTGHGVKLILPKLLDCLGADNWRTKQGSVQMLGSMSFLAPKQLSTCLPQIVPRLTEVLMDSHAKVQAAGKDALKKVGSVIKNPEIQSMVPIILKALTDPVANTEKCLTKLLNMAFVHVIDTPSLALIMPVIERALQDRSTRVKTKAATIIGNMYSLTDPADLAPYLDQLVPGLKESLVDPVPEMRAVASNALGSLVKGMGEERFSQLLPWLLDMLSSDAAAADRAGAAQGLSEVLAALGSDRLSELMPTFLENTRHSKATVREGHLMLFMFLPLSFGDDFRKHVGEIISPILYGLSDIEESVRDAALKTGRTIITNYISEAITLLLPALMESCLDEDWHMRLAALTLCGDLLYQLAGTSGNKSTVSQNEDDSLGTANSSQALVEKLGVDKRNEVLALIYFLRRDPQARVREQSLHTWKVLVDHAMRTLKEIMGKLMLLIFSSLSHESEVRQGTAVRTLGELVRKMGDRMLGDLVPMMKEGLKNESPLMRAGVCMGLSEVLTGMSNDQARSHITQLLPSIKRALVDEDEAVRAAAGRTFAFLHDRLGAVVIEQTVPSLVSDLIDKQSTHALHGLRAILKHKARIVLPTLVSQMLEGELSPNTAMAMAQLVSVDSSAAHRQITDVLQRLIDNITSADEEDVPKLTDALASVVVALDEDNLLYAVHKLQDLAALGTPRARRVMLTAASRIASEVTEIPEEVLIALLPLVIRCLDETDKDMLYQVYGCLSGLCAKCKGASSDVFVAVRDALNEVPRDENSKIAGFSYPRMVEPVVTMYLDNITMKHPPGRVAIVKGLGELAEASPLEYLQPYGRKMVGPLVRFSTGGHFVEKHIIFKALSRIVHAFGSALASFAPQLQPMAVKAIVDEEFANQLTGFELLSRLAPIQRVKRVEMLIKTMCVEILKTDFEPLKKMGIAAVFLDVDPNIVGRETIYLKALSTVLDSIDSRNLSQETKLRIKKTLKTALVVPLSQPRAYAADAYAHVVLDTLDPSKPEETMDKHVFCDGENEFIDTFLPPARLLYLAKLVEIRWDQLVEMYPPPAIYEQLAKENTTMMIGNDAKLPRYRMYFAATLLRIGSNREDDELIKIAKSLFPNAFIKSESLDQEDVWKELNYMSHQFRRLKKRTPYFVKTTMNFLADVIATYDKTHREITSLLVIQVLGLKGKKHDEAKVKAYLEVAKEKRATIIKRLYTKHVAPQAGRPLGREPAINFNPYLT